MHGALAYRCWVCRPTYEILNPHASTLPPLYSVCGVNAYLKMQVQLNVTNTNCINIWVFLIWVFLIFK